MPHKNLFESSLYTSNLYDCKQKSRSHLVLFESVEKPNGAGYRQNVRQTEHSNAFGYLGRPLYNPKDRNDRDIYQTFPRDCQRTSTPIMIPIKNAASRNESSAVRAALGNDTNDRYLNYFSSFGKFQYRQQQHDYHHQPGVDDDQNSRWHATPPTTPPGKSILFRKQLELSPDNGSYWPKESLAHNEYLQSQRKQYSPTFDISTSSNWLYNTQMMSSPTQEQQSSQNRILIKNGKLVNDDAIFKADIYVEDGIIKDIGPHLIVPGGIKTIDANGFYVLPGGIDTHTHFNTSFIGSKTADDFYSGTKAALAGGTTTVMDFVIVEKGQSLIETFKKVRSNSDGIACCDYVFRVCIPEFIKGKTDVEMETLVKEHGINSFKVFMAYKEAYMLRDEDLIQVMNKCRQLGALPLVHAENGDIIDYNIRKIKSLGITGPEGHYLSRPEEVEAEATHRVIMLANQINCPVYIVHVNSRSAADIIAEARNRGCVVYGEPITAGIGSDGTHYFHKCWQHAAAHVMSPPLRTDKSTPEHLINMLASGQLQTVGSDHCVFKTADKAKGMKDFSMIPNGVNGVEERLMILWEKAVKTGKLDPRQFVAVTSTNAAKIFNLYPRKGRLAKGSDADIVIWGPKPYVIRAENHHFNGDFNIFEGTQVSHGPLVVIHNGRVVLDENGLHVVQGSGKYLSCSVNSSYLWQSIRERDRIAPLKVDRDGKEENSNQSSNAADQQNGTVPTLNAPSQYPSMTEPIFKDPNMTPAFYKGTTRSGVRNLQDSSFNLSGAQIDDDKIGKTAIRVQNPPGGRSSGIW